ncbi:nitroreductase [Acinetobacter schindleri]|uniref:nitroreductase n=1 Tax=Acinetobacter schindleri TaxID=108981 RepID=UPI0013B08A3D|nr:nitroreductase [Acinetobacter schindleri]QIC62236.1 nitroreductase [Acinetobacter schindleri]
MDSIDIQLFDQVIQTRYAARAFLDQPIEPQIIKDILQVASWAPSGTNTQPWKVYVVTGQKRLDIIEEVCRVQKNIFEQPSVADQYQESFAYYPRVWEPPYLERRKANGSWLYGLLNINKNDYKKMQAQLLRNYEFFGAPVGLFFTVDHSLGIGSKMDISMMMQNVMLSAKVRGLDTCPQAAWNKFHSIVLNHLNADKHEVLVCGMALGYADPSHIINSSQTSRVPVDEFAIFLD